MEELVLKRVLVLLEFNAIDYYLSFLTSHSGEVAPFDFSKFHGGTCNQSGFRTYFEYEIKPYCEAPPFLTLFSEK